MPELVDNKFTVGREACEYLWQDNFNVHFLLNF